MMIGRLVLVAGLGVSLFLALGWLLLRRVRSEDAAAAAQLSALSLRSVSSLAGLQRSRAALALAVDAQRPLFLACFSALYALKQTFAVPGSALLNVLAGALLPLHVAFPLVAALTAAGASCCFLLSRHLASERVVAGVCQRLLPGKLQRLRRQVQQAQADGRLLFLLLSLRVFPFSPNWLLNLASPWLRVPLGTFATSVLLGLLPYNFITVQAGATLSSLTSTSDLLDPSTAASLVLLASGMLVPALLKEKRAKEEDAKAVDSSDEEDDDDTDTSSSSVGKEE